jgi:predicted DNA-binding protein
MARSDPQLNIRIPLELKERVESAAKESGRSVTSEILKRLEASLAVGEGFEGLTPEQAQAVKFMIAQFK